MKRTLALATPALLVALALSLPFYDKPFTVDDPLFLSEAGQLARDPLHPTRFRFAWNSNQPEPFAGEQPSGPVGAALLVPAILAGGAEPVAHATELALMLLAIVATVSLARKLGRSDGEARLAGLLLATTPAAVAMTATAMPDVPSLAFGVVGIERLLAFRRSGRVGSGLLAMLALALAGLSRSHAWLLLAVGALLLVDGDPRSASAWRATSRARFWPLVGAALLGGLVIVATRDPNGVTLVHASSRLASLVAVPRNLIALGTHWTLAVPLALPLLALRGRALIGRTFVVALVAAAVYLVADGHPVEALLVAPAFALGASVLADLTRRALASTSPDELALATWLLLPLPIAIYLHLPSKYLLPSLPPAVLVVARALARVPRPLARRVTVGALALGALLGVAIVHGDAVLAGAERNAAEALVRPIAARGERVFFLGHWAFQWYATRAGGLMLAPGDARARPGDRLVVDELATLDREKPLPPAGRLFTVADDEPGGRIMNMRRGAGFYSNSWGYLPWSWSNEPVDRFTVYRLR